MAAALSDLHHQWIKDVSGGAFDPTTYPAVEGDKPRQETPVAVAPTSMNAAEPAEAGGLEAHKAALQKLAKLWSSAEEEIRDGVAALHQELRDLYDGDEAASQMEAGFQAHVNKLFDTFDGTLAAELATAAASKTEDELQRAKLELAKSIQAHLQFVKSDPVIAVMEENPLVEIRIESICVDHLTQMAQLAA